ncbi:unnamed protein product [Macrosiphum euphorbiae]|uniref:Uncharacterized protein n=1 Tax=Macrosiphum euphorbiae TaxID=13131 RepID=A0AAV0X5T9_9HEMI|nr:unnamed protein product [Macrosiphum euphorbiae]
MGSAPLIVFVILIQRPKFHNYSLPRRTCPDGRSRSTAGPVGRKHGLLAWTSVHAFRKKPRESDGQSLWWPLPHVDPGRHPNAGHVLTAIRKLDDRCGVLVLGSSETAAILNYGIAAQKARTQDIIVKVNDITTHIRIKGDTSSGPTPCQITVISNSIFNTMFMILLESYKLY